MMQDLPLTTCRWFSRFDLDFPLTPKPIPTIDPEHRECEKDHELDRDQFHSLYRIQTDAGDIDRDPEHPGFEDATSEEDRREYARDRYECVDVRIRRRVIEHL